ncbi:hypothetical protein TIFTF001_033749 [Ficus carica]|uniref:Uncharacterized protein n=3 Tax=Ficus carica TaxID=3494 RepID=A0AA88DZ71_FICCA|nr:hypothetical protein TIFTF001_033749 [Ficus carica]
MKMRYKDLKGPMKTYFDGASGAYFVNEHQCHMESIRNRNPNMHRYLLQADPKIWSRSYFSGRRYAIMTTNIVESLNSVDQKAKLMPVGFLVEWLKELLQRWFFERCEEVLKLTSKLAPKAEKLLRTQFSSGLTVTMLSGGLNSLPSCYGHLAEGWDVSEEVRSKLSFLSRQSVVLKGQSTITHKSNNKVAEIFDISEHHYVRSLQLKWWAMRTMRRVKGGVGYHYA